jgi:glutathione-independent formaldehyde dehydrogenase
LDCWQHLRGAARVYVIDAIAERLEKAGELGAVPIDFLRCDPVEEIRRAQSKLHSGAAFRLEKALGGVTCAIDAIGFQARSKSDYNREDPYWVIEAIAEIVNPASRVSITGVWPPKDMGAVDGSMAEGKLRVPWAKLFNKNTSIHMGRDDDERWNRKLREMIVSGAAKPSRVVSHRLPLEEASNAFERFDARKDGYIKVVLKLT